MFKINIYLCYRSVLLLLIIIIGCIFTKISVGMYVYDTFQNGWTNPHEMAYGRFRLAIGRKLKKIRLSLN